MRKYFYYASLLSLAIAIFFFTGCKVEITVPDGGKVVSKSGAYVCESRQVCTVDISDLLFDEEFVGVPDSGNKFVRWRKVKRGLCGDRQTSCRITSAWAQIHEIFMELLESDDVFYLEPVFAKPGVDVSLTKTADNTTPQDDEIINFFLEVTNIGQETAPAVEVIEKLPPEMRIPEGLGAAPSVGEYDPAAGKWFVGDLPMGATEVLTIPAKIEVSPRPNCIVNEAEVFGSDSYNTNNYAEMSVRQPGIERCADLRPSRDNFVHNRTCGGKSRLTYKFWVYNRGPDEARNVVLNIKETSAYKFPGLELVSDSCTGFQCRWDTISANHFKVVTAVTDEFNNKQQRQHSFKLTVGTSDEDYDESNNTRTYTETILRFDRPCPDYGVPPYS